jgi:anti-anti-sigma regulatory factor
MPRLHPGFAASCHRAACGTIDPFGYMEYTMMISVPGAWDSYKPDELHRRLEPAYAVEQLVINLAGARHVTDTLLAELLELRNHRDRRGLEAALIVVNWPFVRNLLELSGFDRLFRIYDSVELPFAITV